jgi:hypothetical protein
MPGRKYVWIRESCFRDVGVTRNTVLEKTCRVYDILTINGNGLEVDSRETVVPGM